MTTVKARNTTLALAAENKPLSVSFVSEIVEFREMNSGSVQVVRSGGDVNDGLFSLEVSNICDPNTFAPYPSSDINCSEANIIWLFENLPFLFARIVYTKGTDTVGTANVYAIGKK